MITIKKSTFKELYDLACEGWKKKFDEKFKSNVFSEDLSFEENFIIEMQNACNAEQLPVFLKIFKKFLPEDLFSKIKSYTDVCKALGIKELTEKDFKSFGEDARKLLAFHKIKNIERALNGDWKADLKDPNQSKYCPYFRVDSGGLVFYVSGHTDSYFYGSAGLYKDSKTAEFVGRTFASIYQDLV